MNCSRQMNDEATVNLPLPKDILRRAEEAQAAMALQNKRTAAQTSHECMSRYVAKPHHLRRYSAPDDLQTQLNEVRRLVGHLIGMNLSPELNKLMIKTALYQIAHLQGGHKGRYRSQGVLNAAENNPPIPIQLDHVRQRQFWIPRLVRGESVESIINSAFCCVVTKIEHVALKPFEHLDGWDRYRKAEIVAFDMSGEKPVRAFQ